MTGGLAFGTLLLTSLPKSGLSSGVAQWSACWAHNPKVPGSKPGSAIRFRPTQTASLRHESSVRWLQRKWAKSGWLHGNTFVEDRPAPCRQHPMTGGLAFGTLLLTSLPESGLSSGVAQWSACLAHNPKVPGSKPGSAIRFPSTRPLCFCCGWSETEPHKKCADAGDPTAASPITSAGAVLVSPGDGWLGPWYFDANTLAKKWSQQRSGAVASVLGS